MTRFLAVLMLVSLGSTVHAISPRGDAPGPDQPNTISLNVSATPAPTPVLRYELLPRLRDRIPGNAALDYHRAYLLRPNWPRDPKESQAQDQKVIEWEEAPVEKLPVADVRKFLASYHSTFTALDRGAQCDRCDWELTRTLKIENIGTLLPEVQAQRELARFQRLRIRADLAENNFDAAARGLQTGFRLAKDVGEGPSLIQMLVGIALASIFTGETEQFVQRPDAPNLYWAITALPRPFIDPRPALEGEAVLFDSLFPHLKELEKGPVSAERANLALEDTFGMLRRFGADEPGGEPGGAFSRLGLAGYVALQAPEARKQLIALGRPAAEIEKMPPAQVVLLRAGAVIRSLADDQRKCFHLPYPQARAELGRVRERANKMKATEKDVFVQLFLLLVPATEKVHEAHSRLERRLA
ncbi:MAG TPA: hypothetical protein VKE74_13440, partial [Gemmataceae bacterium]|nr:hypothetical protein [Gemmataceae bacterium]